MGQLPKQTGKWFQITYAKWCPRLRDTSEILETLQLRLNVVWCHYLFLQESAQKTGRVAPSTAPCSPAPGRCLLIIRNDEATPTGMFLSFDSILSSPISQAKEPRKPGKRDTSSLGSPSPSAAAVPSPEKPVSSAKRRWGILKSILFNGSSDHAANSSSPAEAENATRSPSQGITSTQGGQLDTPALSLSTQRIPYRSHSFKFSLEFIENGNIPSRDRKLYPPKLPGPAQVFLQTSTRLETESKPLEPRGPSTGPSKYAGRALAEWALLIAECDNFFERRKYEGVPVDSKVETPTLSVEPFRKPG